jgi:hypothetical protein
MNLQAATTTITTPINELIRQVQATGWILDKVDWDKSQGHFYAQAHSPDETRRPEYAFGPDEQMALGNLLSAIWRSNTMRSAALEKVGMWDTNFHETPEGIAEAYANAPVYDPKAAPYWRELGQDSLRRLQVLQDHVQIIPTHEPVPYINAQDMLDDIYDKRKYQLSLHNLDHPVWSHDEAAAFRAVHDILGRAVSGGGFGLHGANRAFAAHAPLLSPTAQAALFTEAVARPAFRHVYPHVRDLGKVATFPEFIEQHQQKENKPGHRGIHPSQAIVPHKAPSVLGKTAAEQLIDPNSAWSSGQAPLPVNAYMHHGDPLQADAVMDNASLIDTNWHSLIKPDGTPDRDRMLQAIVNAFRVVLLSPRKDLRWNAIHYQDIADVPAAVTDPKVYWDTLESKRRAWNTAQGIDPEAHMPYFRFVKPFESIIWQLNPTLDFESAKAKAKEILFDWWTEEQERIESEDKDKPVDKQRTADEIERRANEALGRRLKQFIKDKVDPETDTHEEPAAMSLFAAGGQYNLLTGDEALKYGAFMGTHLKAISQISQHADEILDAALEDVRDHDAAGHHFRAKVLQLNVSGVGPKVCSFAWLLLQPMTSQLGTIDTHMMDVLGHNYEKEMNNRDYFKFERELAAGRDAAGYSHIPLGAFQWGMWDFKRTGEGSHQDHSSMRVLDPVPHGNIDWVSKAQNLKGESWLQQAPDWWQNTQDARDAVGDHWDQNIAPNVPQNVIPYQTVDSSYTAKRKTRMAEVKANTGLSTEEAWSIFTDGPRPSASDGKSTPSPEDPSREPSQPSRKTGGRAWWLDTHVDTPGPPKSDAGGYRWSPLADAS